MFGRKRKVLRDRAAGMVFDWRKGHGFASRLLIAVIVSAFFWAAVLAYVQIQEPESAPLEKDQINLTLVDLEASENRWLAEFIERETLFHRRWDITDPTAIDSAITQALATHSPRTYQATLRDIIPPAPQASLANLPGMGPAQLPLPALVDSVVYASPPANWWVEVRVIDAPTDAHTHGLGNITPFSFPWPSPDRARELSEGEMWTTLLAVDWKGEPLLLEPSTESSNARTPVILSEYRKLKFPPLAEGSPLRWWKLEARLVNRPLSRPPSE